MPSARGLHERVGEWYGVLSRLCADFFVLLLKICTIKNISYIYYLVYLRKYINEVWRKLFMFI